MKLPLLDNLVIKGCPKMKTFSTGSTSAPLLGEIVTDEPEEKWLCDDDLNSTVTKIFQNMVSFRSLERMELSQYHVFKEVWCGNDVQTGVFHNLKALVVKDCDFLSDVLLSFNLLQGIPNLEEVDVSGCGSLDAVFDMTNMTGNQNMHLKTICLSHLPGLKHIWKQNSPEIVSFDNSQGFLISKVQSSRETTQQDDEIHLHHQLQASSLGQVLLPKLEKLILEELHSLETVWNPILYPNSMVNFKTLAINKCGKVENICPSYMQAAFTSLETLTVTECSSVKEIFQLGIDDEECATKLKNIALLRLPQLQQIWSIDSQTSLRFSNLEVVHVEDCNALEHLLPFNIAMDLHLLEEITLKYAGKMKEIVSGRGAPFDCPPKFEFNHLRSLVVWRSPELQGFFSKDYTLACPSLNILDVRTCLKWSLFKKPFLLNEVVCNLEKLALNYEDASLMVEEQFTGEQFHKLKTLILSRFEDEHATFPYWLLQNNINNLESVLVETSSFKEIFIPGGQNRIQTQIKKLNLNRLHELLVICEEELGPTLENLECLWVQYCSKLKHLVPSSVSFSHLIYLEVHNCNGLLHLITSSTASSLVKLRTLKIRACHSLEQVMPEENKETENEIAFSCLEVLELECLPRFKIFCSSKCILKLPLLTKLVVMHCPRMKSFSMSNTSAPKLQKIVTGKQDGKWCWEGDLNRTVDKIFQDKVAYSSFNHLEFSEYPELKELWYGQLGQKIFYNLKSLVVRKSTFLANMLFSSNHLQLLYFLEELEVVECDSLEAVFDIKALNDKETESKEVSRLKKLTLLGLPNLKRIWNREAEEIISFGSLQIVKVVKCPNLKYLFSPSLCQDLRQLEEICIESCGVDQIVSIDEGLLEELKFDFPQLTTLALFNLTHLTNFYPKRYTLDCPSLKFLNIRGCEELQIFAFDHLLSQPLREGDTELQTRQGAMFYIEKVCQNLEELPLNEKDSMRILNGNYEKNLFQSIEMLRLQHFQETPIKFLNDYIQIFPSMTTIQVRCSSFKTLFSSEEIVHCSIAKIETLWLFQLEQLKQIWSDDESATHPLVQNIENLCVQECSGIIRLAPPSASFKNLTFLIVEDCNGLMYLMASFTAKSLVHLTSLTVCNCEMLEEIVMTDEAESQEEITFESLENLELNCLSGFKSFCSGKHTFIFPSLVSLEVVGCPKMQNFSSGIIIAPFLKLIEVENGKKRWVQDLNITIKQLYMDKAIEGVDGHEIVDLRKKEIQVLNIPHTGADTQKICEIGEMMTQDQPIQSTLSLTKADPVIGTEEKKETFQMPLAEADTSIQQRAIYPSSSQALETVTSSSIHTSIQETEKLDSDSKNQEITYEALDHFGQNVLISIERPMVQSTKIDGAGNTECQKICEITEMPPNQASQTLSSQKVDAVIETTGEMDENMERDFVLDAQSTIVQDAGKSSELILENNLSCQTTNSIIAEHITSSSEASKATPSSTTRVSEIDNKEGESDETSNLKVQIESMKKELSSVQEFLALIMLRDNVQGNMISSTSEFLAIGTEEKKETIQMPLAEADDASTQERDLQNQEMLDSVERPLVQSTKIALSATTAIGSEETKEVIQIPLSEADALTHTTVQETDETCERPLVQTTHEGTSSPSIVQETGVVDSSTSQALAVVSSSVQNEATGTHLRHESFDETFAQSTQNTRDITILQKKAINPSSSQALEAVTSSIQDEEDKSEHSQLHPSDENLLLQTTSIMNDQEENKSWKNAEDMSIPASSVQNIATETHVTHVSTIDKPLVQATQNAWDITILQRKESHDSDIHLSKNLFIQTITSMAAHNKQSVGAQETYESNRRFSIHDAQNELSPTIVNNTVGQSHDPEIISESLSSQVTNSTIDENKATIDPSPSKASSSSTAPIAKFRSSFKDLDISVELLPYLEAGVNQHPRVLDWLNTKRRRLVASSSFSLFAEVTRILNTAQRGDFSEDDRNYIKDCCTILQGASFDESWISYVHGCIDEHEEDDKDLNKREVEEAEDQASNLKTLSSHLIGGFSWRSVYKNIFIFFSIYLLVCMLIYGLSKLPF